MAGLTGPAFLVGGTIFFLGAPVKALLEKYFDWFAWALLALGIFANARPRWGSG